ncbi:transcription and mRNA export factor ENY2-like [Argiope bruennichi]|uniref:Transcription and mRNA export factor ENY2 n=1 Tax=Argiope bruennichi TaxID=94029 RepID=A0A8T0FNB7_ARGBR|nr:transcription and mRNA export factor ENY2-like [Argiope bruennichi]KAF8791845.1 hypothetical protein HNY73_003516 [Argiope bruennichi]
MAGPVKIPDCVMEAGTSSEESDSMDYSVASNSDHASPEDESNHDSSEVRDEHHALAYEIVRRKLIETGQMERLKELMERRLLEVGWRSRMLGKCRAIALRTGQNTTYEMLYQPLKDEGKDMIPSSVKYDLLQKIVCSYETANRMN